MKILYLIFASFIIFSPTYSQTFTIYGNKCFGGNNAETAGNVIANGSEIVLMGNSFSGISGNKTTPLCNPNLVNGFDSDYWILSIDTSLNINWQQSIGGNRQDIYTYVTLSNSVSNYLFSGVSKSDSSCNKSEDNRSQPITEEDYWVGNLDNNGSILWEKTLGGSNIEHDPKLFQLASGDFIVIGTSNSSNDGDKTAVNYGMSDFWLVKLDGNANIIWDKVYGGIDNEFATQSRIDFIDLNNGSFILAGMTASPQGGTISEVSRGFTDFWITKLDYNGNQIWDKRYGGDGSDFLYGISSTNDSGFILCGSTASSISGEVSDSSRGGTDIWIIKTDSAGNKEWDKRFGGNNLDYATCIQQTFDNGYLVGGSTRSGAGLDVTEPPYGSQDYWILKLDSLGTKIWDKRFGGLGNNTFRKFIILPDSSIVLFGDADSSITSIKTDPGYGFNDYWLVRFAYDDTTVNIEESIVDFSFSIFPNPLTESFQISTDQINYPLQVKVIDITGKVLLDKTYFNEQKVAFNNFSSGVYFIQLESKDGSKGYSKLFKQ